MPSSPTNTFVASMYTTGPMPPRRWRARIGESRCHQYSPPAMPKDTCSRTCRTGVSSAASYIAGMCQTAIVAT